VPDQLAILKGLTKWAARIDHPSETGKRVNEAFRQLADGRPRPVALEMPLDIMALETEIALPDPEPALPAPPPDEELIAQAKRELECLGLVASARVEDGVVIRMPKAYPIYDAHYRERLGRIRAFIDPISNLHTVGRNGMHKYNNQDHSMLTAMMKLWNMKGAAYDVWAVNTDFEYHEEQARDETRLELASA